MDNFFKSILVPADLSINTEIAVKKALELAESGSTIHLLHVQSYSVPGLSKPAMRYLVNANELTDYKEIEVCMEQWRFSIEDSKKDIRVCTWIMLKESVQEAIEKKATQLGVDLIIIGKNSNHSWFPFLNTVASSKLVQKTGIPVLTVKPGSFHNKTRKVVLPVSAQSPAEKMEFISSICRKFKIEIYLVTFLGNNNEPLAMSASALLHAYRFLKTSIGCPVDYAVLGGRNKAKAILNYAKKINADILLLYPETETRIGWMNRQISDVLPSSTRVEVFTIQQSPALALR